MTSQIQSYDQVQNCLCNLLRTSAAFLKPWVAKTMRMGREGL